MAIIANKFVVLGREPEATPAEEPVAPVVEEPVRVRGPGKLRANFINIKTVSEVQETIDISDEVKPTDLAEIRAARRNSRLIARFQDINEIRKVRKERKVLQRLKRQRNGSPPVVVNPKYVQNTSIVYTESSYLSDLGLTEG